MASTQADYECLALLSALRKMHPLPIEADGKCVGGLCFPLLYNLYDTTHYGEKKSTEHERLTYLDDRAPGKMHHHAEIWMFVEH